MAGIITALKIQTENKERVNVFLDGKFAFAMTAIAAAALRKGQYLNDAEIEQIEQADERDKAYNRAIRFLGFRPRSQAEVERYLEAKKCSPEAIAYTIERLRREQYLDDKTFARFWLENRERFRPRGRQALQYEMRQKGLPGEVIETILGELDEEKLAWTAVESKLSRWKNLDESTFRQKVTAFLSQRGFDYEVAGQTANRAWASLDLSE